MFIPKVWKDGLSIGEYNMWYLVWAYIVIMLYTI